MSRRSSRANLHDLLAKESFEHAVLCTYAFDPEFFEGYCLEHFKALEDNANISVLLDRSTHDELLAAAISQRPRRANVRYLLHPITVPGIFHPKLLLLASKRKGLLIVGSANLTRSGLTTNAEMVGVFRFEADKNEAAQPLFHQALQFLREVANRWPNPDLTSNLAALSSGAGWITSPGQSPLPVRLIHNLVKPIWDQVVEGLQTPVDRLDVLSRYFDATPKLLDRVRNIVRKGAINLWTQNEVTTMTPAWLQHPTVREDRGKVLLCTYEDDGHPQQLHAKALAFQTKDQTRIVWGSANFTAAALTRSAFEGNAETVLVSDCSPLPPKDIERLMDPGRTAVPLLDPLALRTAKKDPKKPRQRLPVELVSASLDDAEVACVTRDDTGVISASTQIVLTFHDLGRARLKVIRRTQEALFAAVRDGDLRLCNEGTTVVHLDQAGVPPAPISNPVFLQNLLDIETGRGQRRERRIREAEQSAAQFALVLQELVREGDMDALKRFLTLCDIPLAELPRAILFAHGREAHEDSDALRALGARNLRDFETLHDAAVAFCKRHVRKLDSHCKRPMITAVPNFMHIALSVGNVIVSQLERALVGLEGTAKPLDVDAWYNHRQRMDDYLRLFSDMVELFDLKFIRRIRERYARDVVRDAIEPDVEPFSQFLSSMVGTRARFDALCRQIIRVQTPRGPIQAEFHDRNMYHAAWWPRIQTAGLAALAHTRELAALMEDLVPEHQREDIWGTE